MFYDLYVNHQLSEGVMSKLYEEYNLQKERYEENGYYMLALIQIDKPDEL